MNTETNNTTPEAMAPPTPPTPPISPPAPPVVQGGPRKSAGLALVLSFFPGLGHIYLGMYQRGITVFLVFFLAVFLSNHSSGLGMVIPFIWFFALIDAYRQAQIINTGEVELPKPRKVGRGSLGFGVFLAVVGVVLLINNFYPIDLSWLANWWPAILIIVGIYLVIAAYNERQKQAHALHDDEGPSLE